MFKYLLLRISIQMREDTKSKEILQNEPMREREIKTQTPTRTCIPFLGNLRQYYDASHAAGIGHLFSNQLRISSSVSSNFSLRSSLIADKEILGFPSI